MSTFLQFPVRDASSYGSWTETYIIPVMAEQFHKSTEQINLTVTVYMVFQGGKREKQLEVRLCADTAILVSDSNAFWEFGGQVWTKTDISSMLGDPSAFLCRFSSLSNQRLLAAHASSLYSSRGICEHSRIRHVADLITKGASSHCL